LYHTVRVNGARTIQSTDPQLIALQQRCSVVHRPSFAQPPHSSQPAGRSAYKT